MTEDAAAIVAGLADVRRRIETAAARAGREAADVTLVAATKTVDAAGVLAAARAGLAVAGENIVQELLAKQVALAGEPDAAGLRWDFIGTLQRNKARLVVGRVTLVHGVDSPRLAEALSARATAAGITQDVLLEVNTSGEATKHGVPAPDAPEAARIVAVMPGLRLRGAMTMAPPRDPDAARRCFADLAALVGSASWPGGRELSMGMTDDFEIAVEEGATLVRIGTAIFGARCDLGLGA